MLLRGIKLLLKQLDLAQQRLIRGFVLFALHRRRFEFYDLLLRLFEISVENRELVRKGGDFLVLLQDALLEFLILGFRLLSARYGGVGLDTERGKFLKKW